MGKSKKKGPKDVYVPGNYTLKSDEVLVRDASAYVMYHQATTVASCLSFDVIRDEFGDNRSVFPHSMEIMTGTQSQRGQKNHIIWMKINNLHPEVRSNEADDSSSDDDDDEAEVPEMKTILSEHEGCVNRIRATSLYDTVFAASWSENGTVNIWHLESSECNNIKPVFTYSGHGIEGFAIDWNPLRSGYLLSGDCNKNIYLWRPQENTWTVNNQPFVSHTNSVEDIQWSPVEEPVFASCSVDLSIKVWDIRAPPAEACMLTTANAHSRDVNVISWNRNGPYLASGGDDCTIKIWDLRLFKEEKFVADFDHHNAAITSIEWHPTDSTIFAASGSDDQLTMWDLAIEGDVKMEDEKTTTDCVENLSSQLLFIHQGQTDIKELHWHPQIPGVIISTASCGFNVFKTISV